MKSTSLAIPQITCLLGSATGGTSISSATAGVSSSVVASYIELCDESLSAVSVSESEDSYESDELDDEEELDELIGARKASWISFFCKVTTLHLQ